MPAVTHFDPPRWLEALGWASLGLAFATVFYLLGHILPPRHRQRMWIMNVVYPVTALQVGLFLGMWIYQEVIFAPGLAKTTASYWMMMQLSMVIGFFTAWPVTAWLVRVGWKERM